LSGPAGFGSGEASHLLFYHDRGRYGGRRVDACLPDCSGTVAVDDGGGDEGCGLATDPGRGAGLPPAFALLALLALGAWRRRRCSQRG